MSDLISRKALIERLGELGWLEPNEDDTEIKLVGIIKQMPTAYDVEKVVEVLEEDKNFWKSIGITPIMNLEKAIKIVKGGGVDD